jgi:hypothetical protein
MNIKLVVIPRELHDRLLGTCDPTGREYEILANSLVIRHGNMEEIQIPCDDAAAEVILKLARSKCPEVVAAIRMLAGRSH